MWESLGVFCATDFSAQCGSMRGFLSHSPYLMVSKYPLQHSAHYLSSVIVTSSPTT